MSLKFENPRQRRNAFLALENCYEQFEYQKAESKKWYDLVFPAIGESLFSQYKGAKRIINSGKPEERFLESVKYFNFDYLQIGDTFLVFPKKERETYSQAFQGTPVIAPAKAAQASMPKRYMGVYKGAFIRTANNELGEMILLIKSSGEACFKSSLGEFEGHFTNNQNLRTLIGRFEGELEDGALYDYTFYIKENCPLQIVYAGVSNIKDIQRRSGVIRANTLLSGKDSNFDDATLQEYYEATEPPKSYKIGDDKGIEKIMQSHLEDMLFAMGYVKTEREQYIPNTLHLTESVAFFQQLNLIPTFPLGESNWEGNYLLYRLATTKTALVVRCVNISADGRVKMIRQANKSIGYELFGRVIMQEGGLLFLSIDTKRNKQGNIAHRGLYGFKVGDYDKEGLKFTNGISCITTMHHKLRGGLEVLVSVKDKSFEELKPRRIKIDKATKKLVGEFSKDEEVISDFLLSHEIVTLPLEPNEAWKMKPQIPPQ